MAARSAQQPRGGRDVAKNLALVDHDRWGQNILDHTGVSAASSSLFADLHEKAQLMIAGGERPEPDRAVRSLARL